jgi:hypothetical protein
MLTPLPSNGPNVAVPLPAYASPPIWGTPKANIDAERGIDKGADAATESAVGALYDTCCRGSFRAACA